MDLTDTGFETTKWGWSLLVSLNNMIDLTQPQTYISIGAILLFSYLYYVISLKQLNWVRNLGDIGYVYDAHENKYHVAKQVQKLRSVGDLPPVYPNGWYPVIESHRVLRCTSRTVNMIGKSFALFRDDEGVVHMLDAYCPHLGANLGAGGQVKGKCLECPFHGWQFDGHSGKCVSIPYLVGNTIPVTAAVHSYCVEEVNGWIHLWFDAEKREPQWTIPTIEQINKNKWSYRGRTEHIINCHIQEVPENGADIAHLQTVHTASMLAGIDLRFMSNKFLSFTRHYWKAQWSSMPEPDTHISELRISHDIGMFGIRLPLFKVDVVARQIGPALVHMHFKSVFGDGIYFHCVTPIDQMTQRVVHNIYAPWWMPNFLTNFFLLGEAVQFERDIMIWNNKRYVANPAFVRSTEDTQIAKHRRWYSQFYSENSPRMRTAKDDTLEW